LFGKKHLKKNSTFVKVIYINVKATIKVGGHIGKIIEVKLLSRKL
jgi:hypothetical protein